MREHDAALMFRTPRDRRQRPQLRHLVDAGLVKKSSSLCAGFIGLSGTERVDHVGSNRLSCKFRVPVFRMWNIREIPNQHSGCSRSRTFTARVALAPCGP